MWKVFRASVLCRKIGSIGTFSPKTVFVRVPASTQECYLQEEVWVAAIAELHRQGFEHVTVLEWEESEETANHKAD